MADAKISALPAASTPLAGTEVLPIVQSGVTDKVAVSDLTAGRSVSALNYVPTGSTVPANGMYLSAANTLAWSTNTTLGLSLSTTALTSVVAVSAPSLTLTTTPLGGASGGTGIATFTAANRIPYAASGSALTTSAGLTFDGTNLVTTGSATAASFIPSGSSVPTNGMYLSAANTLAWSTASALRMTLDSNGALGLGGLPNSAAGLTVSNNITGATTAYEILFNGTVQSSVTNTAYGVRSAISTAATAFTLGNLHHFYTLGSVVGSGSTVTNQFGFSVDSGLTGATNNYGFRGAIPAGTNRWNVYMDGTANNAYAGLSRFGATTVPVNTVDITGSLGRGAPVTKTADFTLAATENWVIVNQAATTTVTLPAASSWTGREVHFKTIQAQTLISASSNVVPQAGGAAGTAILAGTAGNWATLVSDGSNWIVMQGGGLL